QSQRAGKGHDRALGCRIIQKFWAAPVGGDRGCIDDPGAFPQMRKRSLDHEEHTEHIGAKGPDKLVPRDVLEIRLAVLLRRVVYQDIQSTELLHRAGDHLLAALLFADVRLERQATSA